MADDLAALRAAFGSREALYTVHYACQSLTEVKAGPASIACVSMYDVHAGAANAFSLANVGDADTPDSDREVLLLQGTLRFLRDHGEARWLHWKMNRPEYGFEAIADRLRWLGHEPSGIPPIDRRHDLDALIVGRYGRDYAPHPRLPNLLARNGLSTRHARWGADEPALLPQREFVAVQQSTTEKVRLLSETFRLLITGRLQTESSAGDVPFAGAHLDAVKLVSALADRFLLVQRALSRRHAGRPAFSISDEYDAQDLFRSLLVQFFDDVRDEEWTPSYAGGSSRIDFLLPQTRVAVELKWTRPSITERQLGEQLLVDREKYQAHPGVGHLICIVFDYEGRLPNPRGLEQDLDRAASEGSVATTVKIVDR